MIADFADCDLWLAFIQVLCLSFLY